MTDLAKALRRIKYDAISLADAQVIALDALAAHDAQPAQQPPLTDEWIDELIKSCPGEGYALLHAADCTVGDFRTVVRRWARAILEAGLSAQ